MFDFVKKILNPDPITLHDTSMRDIYQSLYPESVRYALQYKGAKMGLKEMQDMLPRHTFEVVYLVAKALAPDHERQRAFIEKLARLYMNPDWQMDDLKQLLQDTMATLSPDVQIDGAKLAQLNRYGSDHWQEAFQKVAESMYAENPDALPCLIAHTPVFALNRFIDVYRQNPKAKLLFVVPAWMQNLEETDMGYRIELYPEPVVKFQVKDYCLFGKWACFGHSCPLQHVHCGNAIFVDDTINTGSTAGKIQSFWHTEYGVNLPQERVRVITDLRGKGYPKAKPN